MQSHVKSLQNQKIMAVQIVLYRMRPILSSAEIPIQKHK